jgi:uncharacterized membrane protein
MNANYIFAFTCGIGVVAGLRSLTAPAAVSWSVYLGWLNLHGSPLAFMGSVAAVATFSFLGIAELIGDLFPKAPKRTAPAPLLARIVMEVSLEPASASQPISRCWPVRSSEEQAVSWGHFPVTKSEGVW